MEKPRGKHIPDEAWTLHEAAIRRLYVEEGKPLTGVIETMEKEFKFFARSAKSKRLQFSERLF